MSKKQHIYEAAAQLFREKGYRAASMRDLAERVQLKASSLYSHIGSKEEILQKICLDNAQRFVEGIVLIEQQKGSNVDKIRALIRLHISIATEDTTSVTVFNDEWKHLSEPFLQQFLSMRKDYERRFLNIIKKGMQEEELKVLEPKIALFTILTSVRWLHYWYKPDRNLSVEELEDNIINILLNGLAKN